MASRTDPKLATYRDKRDAEKTPEPFGRIHIPATGKLFVVQQHAASHLHFDLRLEVDGVLKSWAVPKGPSDDPADKRFAVETEDHPLDYADFEGHIPPGNYGAGHVIVWDRGRFELSGDFASGYAKGKLLFTLRGHKLKGSWTLVRLKSKTSTGKEWLLIKEHDAYISDTGPTFSDTSVLSGLTVAGLARPATQQTRLNRYCKGRPGSSELHAAPATQPMLATPGEAHNRHGWLWELKYDGYRAIACKHDGGIRLLSRNGFDLSERFPEICQVLAHLPYDGFTLDGELVVTDDQGRPSFARMQQRGRLKLAHLISRAAIEQPATFYVFDAISFARFDLRGCALTDRKAVLQRLLPQVSALVYSQHIDNAGLDTYAAAQQMGIEGVVGKRGDSTYHSGRSQNWIKVRNNRSAEFVLVGWSGSKSDPRDMGSIAVAQYHGDPLVYAGHVGSGLSQVMRADLARRLQRLQRKTSPLSNPAAVNKTTHWVTPKIVVEVAFTEYTAKGHLRHPSLQRIRDDKVPADCLSQFDGISPGASVPLDESTGGSRQFTVTNPDKLFFPAAGFSKADLVKYYRQIAPWMLPYLADRPIVLTRYPDGVDGKSFYQRDVPDYVPDWLRREVLFSESSDKTVSYFILRSADDLAYLANMGTLPIHMWHSTVSDLDHPDWCVLDLDPKSAPFDDVVRLALAIGELADEVGLPALPKTSGASGLHVLIPLARQLTHSQSQTLGELLASVIVQRHADIATVARSVRARNNKVYVDYLQNGHGRLIVAPFAVRAEAAASVSMTLGWHEVNKGLRNSNFHIGNARRRMQRLGTDPMAAVLTARPDLVASLHKLAALLPDR